MNQEEWEKGLSKFSYIVSDIFAAHDMGHEIILSPDSISITTTRPNSFVGKFEVLFVLNNIGEVWANIHGGGFAWGNFYGQVDRLAIRCAHSIKSRLFYDDRVRGGGDCEYCVVKNVN